MSTPRPPRLARRLLMGIVTPDLREAAAQDLDELFARDCRDAGPARARRRYWRRAWSFSARFAVERLRDRLRPAVSWLDIKLALRLLVKHPGLTIVGGLALAFAIAVGAATFEFLKQVVYPTLPLADGHRIVGIRLWHAAANGVEEQALFDFAQWRGQIRSIEHLGAFRTVERNLVDDDGVGSGPMMTAEISASAFALARVPALLGRTLVPDDERPGAPDVVVLGHDVWQARFRGDPAAVGRVVQVGGVPSAIVGVMPARFAFPRFHSLWIPLRLQDQLYGPRQGPWINVFGRLAPGATLATAQAELTAIGRRTAEALPATHEHIRPEVMPYGQTVTPILEEIGPGPLLSINLFFVMLLGLVSANIGLLMFARAAARETELALRTALGASRRRITGQLFVEALVLGGLALAIGLAAAGVVLEGWLDVSRAENDGRLPFWFTGRISPLTMGYAAALTFLGAAIAGIGSAVKVTGRQLDARLREATAGGGGPRFGGIWTAVIVAQVAATVAFPATAYFVHRSIVSVQSLDAGIDAERFLSARLEMSPVFAKDASDGLIRAAVPDARYRAACEALARELGADAGVAAVAFATHLPRTLHEAGRIELEDADARVAERATMQVVATVAVGVGYFDVIGVAPRAGRTLEPRDVDAGAVVVNEAFVQQVLEGRQPIGRRIRPRPAAAAAAGSWLEIVGVVRDLGVVAGDSTHAPAVYRAVPPGGAYPMHIAVRMRGGDPASFADRLRLAAVRVDSLLHVHDVEPLDDVGRTLWLEFAFLRTLLAVVSAMALLLSLSGVYAVTAFAVARRRREIGVRVALGADRRRVVSAMLARPVAQIGGGVALGAVLTALLARVVTGEASAAGAVLVAAYGLLMLGICLLASVAPIRRALRVDPVTALRSE